MDFVRLGSFMSPFRYEIRSIVNPRLLHDRSVGMMVNGVRIWPCAAARRPPTKVGPAPILPTAFTLRITRRLIYVNPVIQNPLGFPTIRIHPSKTTFRARFSFVPCRVGPTYLRFTSEVIVVGGARAISCPRGRCTLTSPG